MRTAALAIALLMGSTAIAQTYETTTTTTEPEVDVDADIGVQPDGDLDVDADVDVDTEPTPTTTTHATTHTTPMATTTPASGAVVQPSNADPEHDARGIAVISDPALVPTGFNGLTAAAMGGPLVDPTTGQPVQAADASYPPCTADVTDNCVQTDEVGSHPD